MKLTKKLFRFALWASLVGLAAMRAPAQVSGTQSERIVFQFVLNQVTATTESEQIQNPGQTQHSMFVLLENRPALTCTDTGLDVFFEQGIAFQSDPTTIIWSKFGDSVTPTLYGTVGTAYRLNTSGAVQNLRINPDAFDTTNCLLSVTYVGSTRPVALFDIGGDSLTILATYYNYNVVTADPACAVGDFFTFYNSTDSAFRICENGVISNVGGGGGEGTRIDLPLTSAVIPDGTTSNSPSLLTVLKSALTGLEGFSLAGRTQQFQNIQWTFPIPANFGSAPIFHTWFTASSAIGTFSVTARVRCASTGVNQAWNIAAWDAVNTDAAITVSGAGAVEVLNLTLTNNDSMTAGQLCQLNLVVDSFGIEFDFIANNITYSL